MPGNMVVGPERGYAKVCVWAGLGPNLGPQDSGPAGQWGEGGGSCPTSGHLDPCPSVRSPGPYSSACEDPRIGPEKEQPGIVGSTGGAGLE